MRKFTMGLALCSTALAAPAMAKDDSAYIEFGFGPMLVEDFDLTDVATGTEATLDSEYGFDGAAILGYDFGAVRVELEAGYRQADHDTLITPAATYSGGSVIGDSSVASVMGNLLFDFGPDDGLQGFIGAGAGSAIVDQSIAITTGGAEQNLVNGDEWEFAWQALAGIRAPLTDSIDVGLRYRYFNVPNYRLGGDLGSSVVEGDWTSHSLLGTLTFNFGGPAVPAPTPAPQPAPPPPPPPAPTPAPAPVCETGPYIVFFNWDKSDITPEAATILDNAVSAYANCGTAAVMLAGHTDRSGSATYNMGLAERRNASVRGYLTSRGIPDGRITSEAFGESQPRVPTADGVRELQNRRVEITYGPGSGM